MNRIAAASALVSLVLSWPALAKAETLQLVNQVYQEVTQTGADGRKEVRRVPAAKVVPGDEVLYVITYKNVGAKPADDVVVANPLAPELQYKAGSATGANATAEVSVDGGKTFGELGQLTVASADGKRRAALAGDVTHVRWRLKSSIKPEQQGEVSFRAVLR
ncbi:MAG TPA: hypothetical protein VM074_10230 [Solimonas sp.]|nr:hypothetical protein [Solimonas sp.]